jgi:TIR domain
MSTIKIFVSYSRRDAAFQDELLDFLKGLAQQENIEFWTDQKILTGQEWDVVIKDNVQNSAIALVVVSQSFLDSEYCQKVEIKNFLAQKKHVFPIILSPCAWKEHDWLSQRQFLPGGDETIEEHYAGSGERKRLFLKIREHLRELIKQVRQAPAPQPDPDPIADKSNPRLISTYQMGRAKLELINRLGSDWSKLAIRLNILDADQRRFIVGDEARGILAWLENRGLLSELSKALRDINRYDLAEEFINRS